MCTDLVALKGSPCQKLVFQACHRPRASVSVQGEIHCEQPNASLYTFTGNIILRRAHARSGTIALSPASMLLRGSSLRNTKSIIGAVVFAGHETKVKAWLPLCFHMHCALPCLDFAGLALSVRVHPHS